MRATCESVNDLIARQRSEWTASAVALVAHFKDKSRVQQDQETEHCDEFSLVISFLLQIFIRFNSFFTFLSIAWCPVWLWCDKHILVLVSDCSTTGTDNQSWSLGKNAIYSKHPSGRKYNGSGQWCNYPRKIKSSFSISECHQH